MIHIQYKIYIYMYDPYTIHIQSYNHHISYKTPCLRENSYSWSSLPTLKKNKSSNLHFKLVSDLLKSIRWVDLTKKDLDTHLRGHLIFLIPLSVSKVCSPKISKKQMSKAECHDFPQSWEIRRDRRFTRGGLKDFPGFKVWWFKWWLVGGFNPFE